MIKTSRRGAILGSLIIVAFLALAVIAIWMWIQVHWALGLLLIIVALLGVQKTRGQLLRPYFRGRKDLRQEECDAAIRVWEHHFGSGCLRGNKNSTGWNLNGLIIMNSSEFRSFSSL